MTWVGCAKVLLRWGVFLRFLFVRDDDILVLDVEPEAVVEAHVDICQEDEGKLCEKIPPPTAVEQLEAGDDENGRCDVVAEAVFAGEEVKELSHQEVGAAFAAPLAEVARFAKDLFMGDRPCNAGDWERKQSEHGELM